MPTSEVGVAGLANAQPGLLEPGAGGVLAAPNPAVTPNITLPLIAHVYDNHYGFQRLLHPILNRPVLKETMNSAGHPVTIEVAAGVDTTLATSTATWGNIIQLTQQGGSGSVLYTGIVEDVVEDYGDKVTHQILLQPLGTELGDTFFSKSYAATTDAGQMVRDAVASTAHLWTTPQSVPLTGQLGIYNFNNTTCLDVMNVAQKIAGVNYWWSVDATGCVWFQAYNNAQAVYTVRQTQDYTARKFTSPIGKLKNKVIAVGGIPSGGSAPKVSTYSDAASQATYGTRALMPPLNFPTVTDQPTLDAITNTVGQGLNRKITRVTLTLTNYPNRIVIGQQNPTLRYWEPASYPEQETYTGAGGYSPNYIVLDATYDGPVQTIVVGDIPTQADDYQYQIAQIIHRTSISDVTYVPASLNVMGQINGGGIQTAGPSNARWVIDGNSIRGEDGTTTDRGAGPGITAKIGSDGSFFGSNLLLQSGLTGARLKLDASVPIEQVIDANGVVRAELGNLAPNGISTGGYKMRANDSTGAPIFDSDGLIAVMKRIATNPFGASTMTMTSSYQTVSGSSTSFTTTRTQTVLVMGNLCSASGPATSTYALINLYVNGVQYAGGVTGITVWSNSGSGAVSSPGSTSTTVWAVVNLANGSYSADWRAVMNAGGVGTTLTVVQGQIDVFLLGS